MTTELWMLFAAVCLGFVHNLIPMMGASLIKGPLWGLGNREDTPELEGWAARGKRAGANYAENLPLFVILVVIAILAKKTNSSTALGAEIFVGARVVYTLLYIAGIPYLRSIAWVTSIAGLGMIAFALF